jgi:carboxymethylenebutenolidase
MAGSNITIHGPDGDFSAYQTGEGPALIVLQEIFGVNAVMRELCDDYAATGLHGDLPRPVLADRAWYSDYGQNRGRVEAGV